MTDLEAALLLTVDPFHTVDPQTTTTGIQYAISTPDGWLCYDALGAYVRKEDVIENLGPDVSVQAIPRGSWHEGAALRALDRRAREQRPRRRFSRQP